MSERADRPTARSRLLRCAWCHTLAMASSPIGLSKACITNCRSLASGSTKPRRRCSLSISTSSTGDLDATTHTGASADAAVARRMLKHADMTVTGTLHNNGRSAAPERLCRGRAQCCSISHRLNEYRQLATAPARLISRACAPSWACPSGRARASWACSAWAASAQASVLPKMTCRFSARSAARPPSPSTTPSYMRPASRPSSIRSARWPTLSKPKTATRSSIARI